MLDIYFTFDELTFSILLIKNRSIANYGHSDEIDYLLYGSYRTINTVEKFGIATTKDLFS
jgi:hypothetical protein